MKEKHDENQRKYEQMQTNDLRIVDNPGNYQEDVDLYNCPNLSNMINTERAIETVQTHKNIPIKDIESSQQLTKTNISNNTIASSSIPPIHYQSSNNIHPNNPNNNNIAQQIDHDDGSLIPPRIKSPEYRYNIDNSNVTETNNNRKRKIELTIPPTKRIKLDLVKNL